MAFAFHPVTVFEIAILWAESRGCKFIGTLSCQCEDDVMTIAIDSFVNDDDDNGMAGRVSGLTHLALVSLLVVDATQAYLNLRNFLIMFYRQSTRPQVWLVNPSPSASFAPCSVRPDLDKAQGQSLRGPFAARPWNACEHWQFVGNHVRRVRSDSPIGSGDAASSFEMATSNSSLGLPPCPCG